MGGADVAAGSFLPDPSAVIGDVLGYIGAGEQRSAQKSMLERQLQWTEMMSNSAVQRHRIDMEKAGFNPILAAGGSASSPTAPGYSPENMLKGVGERTTNSALELRRIRKDVAEAESRISLNDSTKSLNSEKEKSEFMSQQLMGAQAEAALSSARAARASSVKTEADAESAKNRAAVEKEHPKAFGWIDAIQKRMSGAFGLLKGIAGGGD